MFELVDASELKVFAIEFHILPTEAPLNCVKRKLLESNRFPLLSVPVQVRRILKSQFIPDVFVVLLH